jgi:1-hydroxycarotenoid 3,4-desaturase
MSSPDRLVVVGAGIGGLVASLLLAARGFDVTLFESADSPGGRMREVVADGAPVDSGPTVFTLRPLFEAIFAAAGASLEAHVPLEPAEILARHAWDDDSRLDLFADRARSEAAIGALAGAREAAAFRAFATEAERIWAALEGPYIGAQQTTPLGLSFRLGLRHLPDLFALRPYTSMWRALSGHFRDPRLQQLFGRYATYAGCSPFAAPATLMLIAHVESLGVWLVRGGMQALARGLAEVAARAGATLRFGTPVAEILVEGGCARGVRLADGEELRAAAVLVNADPSALAAGLFGDAARAAVPRQAPAERSLSAVTLSMRGRASGFPLSRHNVFFSSDYRREFADLAAGRLPTEPTLYVCAQDRGAGLADSPPLASERLLAIINAPALADVRPLSGREIEQCVKTGLARLAAMGLSLSIPPGAMVRTTPADFMARFPGSGGAIYGLAAHGPTASFRRPGARSRIPGLYLAGGGIHPGAGVPMVAMSGRLAAEALMADRVSTPRFLPAAMPGGISMPSPPTAVSASPSLPSSAASFPPGPIGPAAATQKTMSR